MQAKVARNNYGRNAKKESYSYTLLGIKQSIYR